MGRGTEIVSITPGSNQNALQLTQMDLQRQGMRHLRPARCEESLRCWTRPFRGRPP